MRYMAAVLTLVLIFPPAMAGARQGSKITAVVIPVHNKTGDAVTDHAVNIIALSLRSRADMYVVDENKVDDVLRYYDLAGTDLDVDGVDQLLTHAQDSYYRFNYIDAKSFAREAASILTENPQYIYDHGGRLIDAYLMMGIIARSMGDIGEARQAFRKALRLDPDYRLDSRAFPPSMIELFEDVRGSVRSLPIGSIRIESRPRVADVHINGVAKGVTPLVIGDLPEGAYYLKVSANKYGAVRREVLVTGEKPIKIVEHLRWQDRRRDEGSGREFVSAVGDVKQVNEGLSIADLLKVDKAVLLDVDSDVGGSGKVTARVIDRRYRAGHKPIVASYSGKTGGIDRALETLTHDLISDVRVDVGEGPARYAYPPGSGDPVLMGYKKKNDNSKTLLYSIAGVVLAVGLGAGLAAGLSGGAGGGGSTTGSINVVFK